MRLKAWFLSYQFVWLRCNHTPIPISRAVQPSWSDILHAKGNLSKFHWGRTLDLTKGRVRLVVGFPPFGRNDDIQILPRSRRVHSAKAEDNEEYWAIRFSVCSHRSLIRLLRTARFARALRSAHSFARSLTHSLWSSWESGFVYEMNALISYSFNPLCHGLPAAWMVGTRSSNAA